MPWTETTVMDERCRFVLAYRDRKGVPISQLCAEHRISRPTGYKWIRRYEESGICGLYDRSRAPHECPHRMAEEVAHWMLQDRRAHPRWGARKIIQRYRRAYPKRHPPSESAVCALFKREGLVGERKRMRKSPACKGTSATAARFPNELWTMDFKGQFRTGDHRYCYPLTVMDSASRYLLCCHGELDTCGSWVSECVDKLFREYGLPEAIHSDNGSPFAAAHSLGGLSRVAVHWMKLDIRIERSRPACPQDNPAHERMHRTLKAETTRPAAAHLRAQQRRFDRFKAEYNHERPHEAIGDRTPGEVYVRGARGYPSRLREPDYPGHFEVRRVNDNNGCFKWSSEYMFIGRAFSSERLGFEEIDDELWNVYFFNHLIARFDSESRKIIQVPL